MALPLKIYVMNFWKGFSLEAGFLRHLLDLAFGSFVVTPHESDADLVLTSVYPKQQRWYRPPRKQWSSHPEKTIAVIWENQRPDYRRYRFSISSDFDSYGGRNCRVPLWYTQIQWPGLVREGLRPVPGASQGFEPLVDLDSLLRARPTPSAADREMFCCLVSGHPERHRQLCVEQLSSVGRVDLFGTIAGKPVPRSKYEILAPYRFNLCFENSIFPGYYSEKLLHAWVAGCIPLYFSDSWYRLDFNPKAMINRINFSTIDEFVDHVTSINASREAMNELFDQPLLTKRPTLDPAIRFLKQAGAAIMKSSPK